MNAAGGSGCPGPFSAVIPVKDRPDDLHSILTALFAQSLRPVEIVVVDQSESDACAAVARQLYAERAAEVLPALVYVHDPSIDGLTAARNEGIRRSASPVVVFFDDDAVPVPEALLLVGQALAAHPELVGAGGIITNYRRPPALYVWIRRIFMRGFIWDERQPVYWDWDRYARGELAPTRKMNGGFMAIRREALLAVKGFGPRYRGSSVGEDVECSHRLAAYGGERSLALVGGAWMLHESRGKWKKDDRSIEFQVVAWHYIYRCKPGRSAADALRFAWFLAGALLMASISAARRRDLAPAKSFAAGIRCVQAGYAGCPFLKPGQG